MLRGSTMWRRIDPSACLCVLALSCFHVRGVPVCACEYKGNPGPGQGLPRRQYEVRHLRFVQRSDGADCPVSRLGGAQSSGFSPEWSSSNTGYRFASRVHVAGDRACLGWQCYSRLVVARSSGSVVTPGSGLGWGNRQCVQLPACSSSISWRAGTRGGRRRFGCFVLARVIPPYRTCDRACPSGQRVQGLCFASRLLGGTTSRQLATSRRCMCDRTSPSGGRVCW